ncbi:MAG: hypothetical protein WA838_19000, partial [Xanthobacteraceae bacterium]
LKINLLDPEACWFLVYYRYITPLCDAGACNGPEITRTEVIGSKNETADVARHGEKTREANYR